MFTNIVTWLRYKGILSLKPAFEVVCVYPKKQKPTSEETLEALVRFTQAVAYIPFDAYIERDQFLMRRDKKRSKRRKKHKTTKKARRRNR